MGQKKNTKNNFKKYDNGKVTGNGKGKKIKIKKNLNLNDNQILSDILFIRSEKKKPLHFDFDKFIYQKKMKNGKIKVYTFEIKNKKKMVLKNKDQVIYHLINYEDLIFKNKHGNTISLYSKDKFIKEKLLSLFFNSMKKKNKKTNDFSKDRIITQPEIGDNKKITKKEKKKLKEYQNDKKNTKIILKELVNFEEKQNKNISNENLKLIDELKELRMGKLEETPDEVFKEETETLEEIITKEYMTEEVKEEISNDFESTDALEIPITNEYNDIKLITFASPLEIKDQLILKGNAEIIGIYQKIGRYSGMVELEVDNKPEHNKKIMIWDQWCNDERQVIKIKNISFEDQLKIKILEDEIDTSSCEIKDIDWRQYDKKLIISKIFYKGNFTII